MLDEKTIELAKGSNLAVVGTTMADGSIQVHPMWCDTDGEHIIVNTEVHRPKFANFERGGPVTVLIQESGNHWSWSEVRGEVAEIVKGPEARAHIDSLAKVYIGADEYPNPIVSERVMVKIRPQRVMTFPGAG